MPGKLSEPARAVLPKAGRANASRQAQEPDKKNPKPAPGESAGPTQKRRRGWTRSSDRRNAKTGFVTAGELPDAKASLAWIIPSPLLCWFGYKWRMGSFDCFSRYATNTKSWLRARQINHRASFDWQPVEARHQQGCRAIGGCEVPYLTYWFESSHPASFPCVSPPARPSARPSAGLFLRLA